MFNEADAVLSKRKEINNNGIGNTVNAIQNILLQEMENLEGIAIGTTNFTQRFDKAFERRFLYKIEFDKPTAKTKEKIWHTMLPALCEEHRIELSTKYDFSGGQIENIARKFTVDSIINGAAPTIETLHNYCASDVLHKDGNRIKIRFN